ncbi:helix-turn-helix domain-containing protein [Limosilactobacillus kribbianus]|uniref:helix-turn-helix domain-containing protein n=1 Tax=Limosilactobacillus kribbianus TaxID=2982695 RepID=UPI0022656797|nr:AraC family transcriptional regulator [Limosilactobacillus kribbianus]
MKVDESKQDISKVYLFNSDRPFHYFAGGEKNFAHGHEKEFKIKTAAYELVLCAAGRLSIMENEATTTLKPTEYYLIPAETVVKIQPAGDHGRFYWFQFLPKDDQRQLDFSEIDHQLVDRQKLSELANNVILPAHYHVHDAAKIETACQEALLKSRVNYYTDAVISYTVTQLLLEIANDFLMGLHQLTMSNPRAVEIISWVQENLDSQLTVQMIADHFGMNYRYVSRLIKKETGMTAANLIIQKKIDIARNLLLNSNLPLKVIANQAYFNDVKYFMRIFKKRVGLTPTQFRQQYMVDFLLNDTKTRHEQDRHGQGERG